MTESELPPGLLLKGLDGSNPLGFLAAVGTAIVAHNSFPEVRFGWMAKADGWRPVLEGCGKDENDFSRKILDTLKNASMDVFDIDPRMPFEAPKFSRVLRCVQDRSSLSHRRTADFLSAFGTELYPRKKKKNGKDITEFQDSAFRMVRSGDSAGQGLPFYAKTILNDVALEHIRRALFRLWDYKDEAKKHSLRWDPIEDRRYALRWQDPTKPDKHEGTGTMWAANALAVEALRWFPTVLVGRHAQTTGFHRTDRHETYFVWPVWTSPISVHTLRSLLALEDLYKTPLPRSSLADMGIEEVYRSERIQQNQYYRNFAPARPSV